MAQVFGQERVAITIPESAAIPFHEALRLCLGQLPSQPSPGSQQEESG